MVAKQQDILIIVKTYPEISSKYTETVCTVGIKKKTKELVRIYPIRYRYLEGDSKFKKYQWIRAKLEKANTDQRPESYNIFENTIQSFHVIGTKDDWNERVRWVLSNKNNIFESVEKLQEAQKKHKTSLGIVKIKKDQEFYIKKKTDKEIKEAEEKKRSILKQQPLFETIKHLELLPVRYGINFSCKNESCKGHKMSILDWEFAQLYRNLKYQSDDVEEKMKIKVNQIFSDRNDTYAILGNMSNHQGSFCILGFFYPPKRRQMYLF